MEPDPNAHPDDLLPFVMLLPRLTCAALIVHAQEHLALVAENAPSAIASMDQTCSALNEQLTARWEAGERLGISPEGWVAGTLVNLLLRERFPELDGQ